MVFNPDRMPLKQVVRGLKVHLECAKRAVAEMDAATAQQQQQQQQQQPRPSTEGEKHVKEGGNEETPLRFDTGAAGKLAADMGNSLRDSARWKSLGTELASGVRSHLHPNMVPSSGLKAPKLGRAMIPV